MILRLQRMLRTAGITSCADFSGWTKYRSSWASVIISDICTIT